MNKPTDYSFQMALIAEVYFSTLSAILKEHGLERYFVPLIYLCENNGEFTQADLCKVLRRDKVSTKRMVDYLCDLGFVVRKDDPVDKRCNKLEATEKAFEILPEIHKAVHQTNDIIFADFEEVERNAFEEKMNKLMRKIMDLPQPEFIVQAIKRRK